MRPYQMIARRWMDSLPVMYALRSAAGWHAGHGRVVARSSLVSWVLTRAWLLAPPNVKVAPPSVMARLSGGVKFTGSRGTALGLCTPCCARRRLFQGRSAAHMAQTCGHRSTPTAHQTHGTGEVQRPTGTAGGNALSVEEHFVHGVRMSRLEYHAAPPRKLSSQTRTYQAHPLARGVRHTHTPGSCQK